MTFAYACPAVVNDGTVFDRLSRKESLRRHESRLARRGTLRFRHIENRNEILRTHLDRFAEMQIARLALNGVRSRLLTSEGRAMLRGLIAELDLARQLRFSVLELDEKPIAYHLGLEHAGKYVWYMPTFDVDLWNDAPGEVLLRNLLKYAHERQLAEFDFTIGDEEYKNRFANAVRRTFTVYVDRRPYRPAVQVRRMVRSGADAIRRRPELLARARRVRAFVHRLAAGVDLRHVHVGSVARALYSSFRKARVVAYRRVEPVAPPDGVRVTRLTLKGLARLRLEYRSLDHRTVRAMRRRMNDEIAYIARADSSAHVFWVSPASHVNVENGVHATAICISEGTSFGDASPRTLAEAMAALLCTVGANGDMNEVLVRSIHSRAVESAARRAGYAPRALRSAHTVAKTTAPAPLGSTPPSSEVRDPSSEVHLAG